METQTRSSIHPVAWAAGIAVIIASMVGIGAMTGLIPTSIGSDSAPAIESKATPTTGRSTAAPVARSTPTPVRAPVKVAAKCVDCGVIESVREVTTRGEGSGLGAVGGAVAGGLLGNQVGSGRGQDAMTVVGAVGGAVAGHQIEKRVKSTTSYAVTIRLDDGTSRVVTEANAPSWRAGDKVRVVNGAIQSNA